MSQTRKIILIVSAIVAVPLGLFAIVHFAFTSSVMTKPSPDRRHTAKLTRLQAIDINFIVTLDGTRVYVSPDFAHKPDDFREQLKWTRDSQVVVLEVAGRHLFGYHVGQKRALADQELGNLEFAPFEDLGFEGDLPTNAADQ